MTENKNLNHTFSSDVNMPLYLIRIGSLYPLFCFFGGSGGRGLWSYVHHTVDVKILCLVVDLFLVSMPYLMILSN